MLQRGLPKSNTWNICFGSVPRRRMPVRLTVYTDYALRLLMYLALKDDGLATIAEVAGSYGISKNHLTKVAHQLGVGGYVGTVRGRGGGLRLAKPAEKIGLGEVVRRTEPDLALVPCFSPIDARCAIRSCCVLRSALDKARDAFIEVLRLYHRRPCPIANASTSPSCYCAHQCNARCCWQTIVSANKSGQTSLVH
jgi:Rrf2 family transcriptional regulator, nitric oxide-sensitive transcriptional repressor